jgi:uncharacterized protein DUF4253
MGLRVWITAFLRQGAPSPADQQIARWQKALSDFGYPYDLVSGSKADEALAAAKILGRQNGFVPVVVAPGYWNSVRIAPDERARHAREILQRTDLSAASGRQFLADRLFSECPNLGEFGNLKAKDSRIVSRGLLIVKRDPAKEGATWDEVAIVRVPAALPEELAVYLWWGGWNAAPTPEMIVAVARYWKETYGSELVGIGADNLEFRASRKPLDHASAIALLKEHYAFAPDNFEFYVPFLEDAAAYLRTNSSWGFWWD